MKGRCSAGAFPASHLLYLEALEAPVCDHCAGASDLAGASVGAGAAEFFGMGADFFAGSGVGNRSYSSAFAGITEGAETGVQGIG